jgi:hypothetical protein
MIATDARKMIAGRFSAALSLASIFPCRLLAGILPSLLPSDQL